MDKLNGTFRRCQRALIVLLVSILCAVAVSIVSLSLAYGEDNAGEKVVRVGWFESPFNMVDSLGRRSGYAYEYERKIACYTGWTYEYVEGSWPELLEMLKAGEIDLLSDVSYVEERARDILYSSMPMGTESYYVFIDSNNTDISPSDLSTLNGKTVGVTKNSIQREIFLQWEEAHGIDCDIKELTASEEDSLTGLLDGSIDAYVTLDIYGAPGVTVPICKVGSSDFFFAVNKARPDLLSELDAALSRIQDENRYYSQGIHDEYLTSVHANRYLSQDELAWVERHGPIRVGYQDNYLAFCAADPKTADLTGALSDYLAFASTCFENAAIDFEARAYPTVAEAAEAMRRGEVDCIFPANLTEYDAEMLGVAISPPIMGTEMEAVVRATDQKEFLRKKDVTVAVNEGNTNYEMFLVDNFPDWQVAYFADTPAALKAVATGDADCVIVSNYRFGNISKLCEKLHLARVSTGVDLDFCFATRMGETELYSVISKVTGAVPESATNAALTYYSTEDVKVGFGDFVADHLVAILAIVVSVLLVVVLLLVRAIRAERRAREEERMVQDLNERVFVDALTGVRNKGAYTDCLQDLQSRIDAGEDMEFAIGIFDCDDLKTVNDVFGHDKGDEYLRVASRLICEVYQHSPVFRIGGDEFAVILQGEDYEGRCELAASFEGLRERICAAAENKWDEAHVAYGFAVHNAQLDQEVYDTARRADKIMYENKRMGKALREREGRA